MSTFAVFGMTRGVALASARKSVPTRMGGGRPDSRRMGSSCLSQG